MDKEVGTRGLSVAKACELYVWLTFREVSILSSEDCGSLKIAQYRNKSLGKLIQNASVNLTHEKTV